MTAHRAGPSDEQFRIVANQAPVLIWMAGADGRRSFFNQRWLEFRGRSPEQEAGDGWTEGVHPNDLERMHEVYSDAAGRCEEVRIEYRLRRHDGAYRWVLDSAAPLCDERGEVTGYVGSCVDITDRRQAEESLRAQEQRFRWASEGGRLGTWEWDLDQAVTWSESLEALYGLEAGSFPGTITAFIERLHPDDRERVGGLVAEAVHTRSDLDFEERILLPSGEVRWLQSRARLLTDEHGEPQRMVGVCIDVTDRKRSEEDLAESRARAQAVLDTAVNAIITIDEQGRIESMNPAAERMFGYAQAEVMGENVKMLMPSPYREEHDGYLEHYLETGERRIIGTGREVEGLRKDGSRFAMELAVSEIRLNGRRLFTGIVNDISERRRAEFAVDLLAQAGVRLHQSLDEEATLNGVADLLVPQLADWVVLHLVEGGQPRHLLVRHRDPQRAGAARELEEHYVPNPATGAGIANVLRTGVAELVESVPRDMIDGAPLPEELRRIVLEMGLVSYICVPISSTGKIVGALTVVTSETGRHYDQHDLSLVQELGRRIGRAIENARLFRDSELTRSQLQRSIEAKDEFLGIVSHELRTPVTTIYGSARLINQRWDLLDANSLRELNQGIEQEAERMYQLVENLLLLARLEMGQTPERSRREINSLVEEAIGSLKETNPGREIRFTSPEGDTFVDCVPTYVQQMVTNFLTNADKYSPSTEPIQVRVERDERELRLAVLDRGPGVDPEELPLLFESFYRSPKVASKLPGKGLGLAVCRRLAEVQEGRVWAQLRPEGGLEVGFAIPCAGGDAS